jgi:hypothetical protein
MVLAQKLKRPVHRRIAVMRECVQTLLPCRHLGRAPRPDLNWLSKKPPGGQTAPPDKSCVSAYIGFQESMTTCWQKRFKEGFMAFRVNYGRDRAERDRAARARTAEKLKKREEKSAQRKALRAAAEAPAQSTEHVTEQAPEQVTTSNVKGN